MDASRRDVAWPSILAPGADPGAPWASIGDAIGLDALGSAFPVASVVAVAVAVGGFLWLLRETWRGRVPTSIVLTLAVAFHVALVFEPLLVSRDVYSYIAHGQIVSVHGANPYVATPADFPGLLTRELVGPKWADTPSVYGPLFSHLAGVVTRTSDQLDVLVDAFRLLAIAASLATSFVIGAIVRRVRPGRAAGLRDRSGGGDAPAGPDRGAGGLVGRAEVGAHGRMGVVVAGADVARSGAPAVVSRVDVAARVAPPGRPARGAGGAVGDPRALPVDGRAVPISRRLLGQRDRGSVRPDAGRHRAARVARARSTATRRGRGAVGRRGRRGPRGPRGPRQPPRPTGRTAVARSHRGPPPRSRRPRLRTPAPWRSRSRRRRTRRARTRARGARGRGGPRASRTRSRDPTTVRTRAPRSGHLRAPPRAVRRTPTPRAPLRSARLGSDPSPGRTAPAR